MSFSDLRKNKGNSFAKLQKQLESSTKVGTVDERFWKLSTDKAGNGYAVLRFLPAGDGEDMPFVKMYSHAFQGPGGWYIENSLTTLGKEDPLGEYNRELWNSGDEDLKNKARKQKRKLSYYSNIYVVTDPLNPEAEGTVRLFRYGKKIHDKIMEAVTGDALEKREGINPFCFWEGADFKLRVKKVAGYANYDSSEFSEPGVLEDLDDAQLESIWKRCYSLEELVSADKFKSYDQLKARLDRVLGNSSARSTVQEAAAAPVEAPKAPKVDVTSKPSFSTPSPTVSSPKPMAPPEAPAEEKLHVLEPTEDDSNKPEDVMDYFGDLLKDLD